MEMIGTAGESATKFQLNLQIHRLTSGNCSKASSTWKKHGLESAEKLLNRKGVITWQLWAAISHHNNSTAMTKDTVKDQQRWEEIRRHSFYMQDALIQLASYNILPQQSSVEDKNVLQRLMGNCYFSVYKKSQHWIQKAQKSGWSNKLTIWITEPFSFPKHCMRHLPQRVWLINSFYQLCLVEPLSTSTGLG